MSATWQDRVRDSIKLISPSGLEFTPGWKGDDMSLEKSVAQFRYPNINGTEVQDLGRSGFGYTLTLYFEGADNDKESLRFMKALGEIGSWTVVHPVDGTLTLQPIGTAKRPVRPVESGNLTVVTTEWIVPFDAENNSASSTSENAAAVDDAKNNLNDAASESVSISSTTSMASQIAATVSAVRKNLNSLKKKIVAANARVNAIQSAVSNLLTETTVNMSQISGGVIELMQSPGLFVGSLRSQLSSMSKVGTEFIANLPTALSFGSAEINEAVIGELFINATLSGMASIITSAMPESRPEALMLLSLFNDFSDSAINALDDMAGRTSGNNIDSQYFGGKSTAESLAMLRASVARYLLSVIGNLKTERRFTLDRSRGTIEFAITEYNSTAADADKYYRFVCMSNNLHGRELLLLPVGKEMVTYV